MGDGCTTAGSISERNDPATEGGYRPGSPVLAPRVTLLDDECVLDPGDLKCARTDLAHHYRLVEVRTLGGATSKVIPGRCLHRHTEPVTLIVTGEVVGHLCLNCKERVDDEGADVGMALRGEFRRLERQLREMRAGLEARES